MSVMGVLALFRSRLFMLHMAYAGAPHKWRPPVRLVQKNMIFLNWGELWWGGYLLIAAGCIFVEFAFWWP